MAKLGGRQRPTDAGCSTRWRPWWKSIAWLSAQVARCTKHAIRSNCPYCWSRSRSALTAGPSAPEAVCSRRRLALAIPASGDGGEGPIREASAPSHRAGEASGRRRGARTGGWPRKAYGVPHKRVGQGSSGSLLWWLQASASAMRTSPQVGAPPSPPRRAWRHRASRRWPAGGGPPCVANGAGAPQSPCCAARCSAAKALRSPPW